MTERLVRAGDEPSLLPDVFRSELAKLLSLRSTYLMLISVVLVTLGASVALCEAYVQHVAQLSLTQLDFNPTSYSLSGILLAQLAVAIFGALAITSEHGTGSIRGTFAVVPQRGRVLAGKAAACFLLTLVAGQIASFSAFAVGQRILAADHVQQELSDPAVLRAVIGAGVYLPLLALLSLAIGTILRNTAGSIAALFAVLLVLPATTEGLPHPLQNAVNPYLPGYAGQAIFHTTEDMHLLPPWQGLAVFVGYTSIALVFATALLRHRDV
ncbi:MAG: ABC transporter permease subunit [Mycobacteriales bacterium]